MIENSIKREIINDWAENFPELSIYSQNKLYKICGPFVFGVELLSLPRSEDYRPIFVCYPLWKSDIKLCLDEPIFMEEIRNKKGFQFNIPYKNHKTFLQEAVECTKKQAVVFTKKSVTFTELLDIIDKQFSQTLIKSSPVGQAKLFEGKFYGALYVNELNKCSEILEELSTLIGNYDLKFLEWKFGDLNVWLEHLQMQKTNQEFFFNQIKKNKEDKKISKLNSSELRL